ncbi:MAG: hypothetical protein CFE24_03885 [Flavobacterium sp. BFFFF2]|nr:MAG: hypothetical protein CFE24_03885 [Flavobacterium sp. BFFFF2]
MKGRKKHDLLMKKALLVFKSTLGVVLLIASMSTLVQCTKTENPGPSNSNTYNFSLIFDSFPYDWAGLANASGVSGGCQIAKSQGYVLTLRTEVDAESGLVPIEITCSLPDVLVKNYKCTSDSNGGPIFSVITRDLTGNRYFRATNGTQVDLSITSVDNNKGGTVVGSFNGTVKLIGISADLALPKTISGQFTAVNSTGF